MSTKKVFDVKELQEFFGEDEDILLEVFQDFKIQFDRMINEIISAKDKEDFEVLERTIHTLKGVFRNYFVHELTQLLQELENQAAKSSVLDFDDKFPKCLELSKLFFEQFQEYLDSQT